MLTNDKYVQPMFFSQKDFFMIVCNLTCKAIGITKIHIVKELLVGVISLTTSKTANQFIQTSKYHNGLSVQIRS